jgi:hypothetical protein
MMIAPQAWGLQSNTMDHRMEVTHTSFNALRKLWWPSSGFAPVISFSRLGVPQCFTLYGVSYAKLWDLRVQTSKLTISCVVFLMSWLVLEPSEG